MNIIIRLKNAVIFFIGFALLSLILGGLYNYVDGEFVKYQERQIQKEVTALQEYRRNLTGNEILNVQSLLVGQKTEDGKIRSVFNRGEDIPFVFCREPIVDVIAGLNVRSYYRDEGGVEVQSRQRTLPDGILYENRGNNCPELKLFAMNLPIENGTFSFCQTVQFKAWEFNKTATYCSDNKFQIIELE